MKNLTKEDIENLENTTVFQLAQQLEDGLLHSCNLDEEMTVLEFIKYYLHK
ncbi:hypothetical protein [uncultured Metabacillus sp.]|uniref:hypothetical protein n=1 Tax=uncultured Metabacillus sp. TaxID=2860135 RepID=UPI002632BEB1|nr:hypothetical protein [uncultured Metabacillus sp.]